MLNESLSFQKAHLHSLHNLSKSNPKGQKTGCLRPPYLKILYKMPWDIFLYFWNRIKTCLHEQDENQLLQLQCCTNLHSSRGWWEQNCSKQVFHPFCMCSRPVLFCNINICHKIWSLVPNLSCSVSQGNLLRGFDKKTDTRTIQFLMFSFQQHTLCK